MMRKEACAPGWPAMVPGLGALLLAVTLGGCGDAEMESAEASARRELSRTQQGWSPITKAALAPEDFDRWEAEREKQDPGFMPGDFFGDGRPAFAALVRQEAEGKTRARLIVMGREPSGRFVTFTLHTEAPVQRTPMIWKSGANEYEVIENDQPVRIPVEGVIYTHPGVGQKLFFWHQTRFVDMELSTSAAPEPPAAPADSVASASDSS